MIIAANNIFENGLQIGLSLLHSLLTAESIQSDINSTKQREDASQFISRQTLTKYLYYRKKVRISWYFLIKFSHFFPWFSVKVLLQQFHFRLIISAFRKPMVNIFSCNIQKSFFNKQTDRFRRTCFPFA